MERVIHPNAAAGPLTHFSNKAFGGNLNLSYRVNYEAPVLCKA